MTVPNGRFSALLNGVIESAPFQKQRKQAPPIQEDPKKTAEVKSGAKQVTQN